MQKYQNVHSRITYDQYERLVDIAGKRGISMATLLRDILQQWLDSPSGNGNALTTKMDRCLDLERTIIELLYVMQTDRLETETVMLARLPAPTGKREDLMAIRAKAEQSRQRALKKAVGLVAAGNDSFGDCYRVAQENPERDEDD